MTRAALGALLSHWRRQPLQLVTLLLGLALATGLWSAVQAINAEARASYARAASLLEADARPVLTAPDGAITLERFVDLRRAGWLVSPVLEGRTRLGDAFVTVLGVDFVSYPALPVLGAESDEPPEASDILLAPGRLFADAETAARMGDTAGLPPLVISPGVPPGLVLTDIGVAETLLRQPGRLSRLLVLDNQPLGRPPLADIAPGLQESVPDTAADTARLTDSFHLNLTAFGLLSFAVGLFIVHGAVGLAFEQRRPMVRTLRALGLPGRRLALLMLGELVALALLAGLVGLGLGYAVAAALLPDVAATLRGLYGANVPGSLSLRPVWALAGLAMAVGGALIAGGQGLWQLARLPVLAGAAPRAWALASAAQSRLQAVGGVVLAGLGIAAVWLFDGLLAGFAFLAGGLLGAALLLPPCLGLLLRAGQSRARSPLAQWFWADLRAQLPGLSLALMALLLALAANIGVGTMVSSFRLTFTGWLDQRLASELYVTARDDAQAADIREWLTPRVDAVLPIRSVQTDLAGAPGRIYGIVDHPTYRDNWPMILAQPDVWHRVMAGEAALVNEQLARRADLWTGASLTLGTGTQLPVAGVYSDYGNPNGQAILALDLLLREFTAVPDRQYGVRIDRAALPDLMADLRATFDLPATGVVDQATIKALSLEVFETTFSVTGALNVLTLGVAGFAILTSLLTLWTLRLPQLAPVWALGMTRAQLARLEFLRSLCLAAMTALLALPVGLALAWALLAVINVEAFGWRLPMYLFPLDWVRLGGLALIAAGLAAALPARRLARTAPATLLKVFADAR